VEIRGEFKEGNLNGRGRILFKQGNSIDGFFVKGVLHGFARYFDERGRLTFIGNHKNGQPDGTCWKIIPGGGSVVGRVDRRGRLTGSRVAYIYPDYETALVGVFEDGVMRMGKEAEIYGYVEDEAGIKVPIFSKHKDSLHVRNCRQFDEFGKGEFYNHLLT
jgi:histone-lysine N-methyltransferase SETD7